MIELFGNAKEQLEEVQDCLSRRSAKPLDEPTVTSKVVETPGLR